MERLLLFTGKGGVGKTSIAAATAALLAENHQRTLLVSADLAHNLRDILQTPAAGEMIRLTDKLHVLEVDPLAELEENWEPAQDYFAGFLQYLGLEDAVAEEVALFPGVDELFMLTRIIREAESGRYDAIVMDCAPTAGTLRLLTFTDSACTKFNKMIEIERKVMVLIRPLVSKNKTLRALTPSDECYRSFEKMVETVGRLGILLKDSRKTSIRLVLNPDRISVAESRRAFTYFGLFGFPVDAVLVNKVLPPALSDGYLHDWCAIQQEQLKDINESFLDVNALEIPLLDHEPIGYKRLVDFARQIYKEHEPDAFISSAQTVTIEKSDGCAELKFELPGVDKSELDVGQKGGDLFIRAGDYHRVFTIPDSLAKATLTGARCDNGILKIHFEDKSQ